MDNETGEDGSSDFTQVMYCHRDESPSTLSFIAKLRDVFPGLLHSKGLIKFATYAERGHTLLILGNYTL